MSALEHASGVIRALQTSMLLLLVTLRVVYMKGEINSYRFEISTRRVHTKFHFGYISKRPNISFRVVFT